MRVLYVTAGAAGMYCGSCLRDNALAAELKRQGHDVTLMPLYTPTLTDEANVSSERVFFGGISVFLEQHSSIFRHTPRVLDRLWDSRWALKLASRSSLHVDPESLGDLTVSILHGRAGKQRKEIDKLIDWLREAEPYDVINLPNSLLISLAEPIKKALMVPVCCTMQGEELFLDGLPEPYHSEALELIRSSVVHVDRFLAVSEYSARHMEGYLGIPREKIVVVPLGINLDGYAVRDGRREGDFTIGYLARIAPEKGLHLLAEAYKILRRRDDFPPARLEVAGYLAAEHRPYLDTIRHDLEASGLGGEFRYHGAVDREHKISFLRGLDVLSVPAAFDEPKGLFLLEAMAAGVPVVQPRRGTFTELVERTGGGLLVAPDDVQSLADGFYQVYDDPERANGMALQGAQAVRNQYSASAMATRAVAAYEATIRASAAAGERP